MKRYIALLRGINVGGKNKVVMKDLKVAFEQRGFTNVITYINSGNIVFTSEEMDVLKTQTICRDAIQECSGLNVPVAIIDGTELAVSLQNAPAWWGNDATSKHNAIFVVPPYDCKEIMRLIERDKLDDESLTSIGQVIFWSAPIETLTPVRLSKVVRAKDQSKITIRNDKTTRAILKLL